MERPYLDRWKNYLNEESAKQINLKDPAVKSKIKVYAYSEEIEYIPSVTGGPGFSYKSLPNSEHAQIKGMTFKVLNSNKIEIIFPSVQLLKNCRFYAILKVPGLKDLKISKFGDVVDRNLKNNNVVGLDDEDKDYGPSPNIGKTSNWSFPNKLVIGNKLDIVINATKARYYNG
jgi:hypothetical protein